MTDLQLINRRRGWIVVGLGFISLAFMFGTRSSVSMVLPLWQLQLGWTGTQVATGASVVFAMMAIGSPIAGNFMDRYGGRLVMAVGLAAAAIGIGTTSFISSPYYYFIFFGIIGGIGQASVSIPLVTAIVSGYFDRLRGLAIGIAVAGASAGQLPILSSLGILIAFFGWRTSYQLLAIILGLITLLVIILLKPPINREGNIASTDCSADDRLPERLQFLFSNRVFIPLFGAFTLCGFTTAGVIDVYFVPYAISAGYTLVEASTAYGIHGMGNLIGVILFSWLADQVNRPRLLALMFFLRALTFILLIFISTDLNLMFAFAVIFGVLNFATFPVIANIVATHIGVGIIGLTLGLLFGGHSLGAAVGAFIGGWIFDLTAQHLWIWWLSFFLAILAGSFALLVKENRLTQERTSPA